MALTQARIRIILRWVHLLMGLVVMCYIYSPFHQQQIFQIIVKFFVIPIITLSGLWIWKFAAVNKYLRIGP